MKKSIALMLLAVFPYIFIQAQNNITGVVLDGISEEPIPGVILSVKENSIRQITAVDGRFSLQNLPSGKYLITIKKENYETQNYLVNIKGVSIHLGSILLYKNEFSKPQELSTITITDDELEDNTNITDNISGLLQTSKDTYLRTVAYDFSSSFYKIRGLDSKHGTVLINGIEMNKMFTGRPQWSNWGGLNNATRNQEFNAFLTPSNYSFGGLLGLTYINVKPSEQRPGIKISYASSNRSYLHRVMGTYNTGVLKNGWAFSFSASRRTGQEGFVNGTSYNAFSLLASIEKRLNENHTVNFTSIYTPNQQGKSSSNTQEVFNLKGVRYNSFWGLQGKEIRNSRIKKLSEPIFIFNHFWDMNANTSLQTNIGYQYGLLGNSRLEFLGTNLVNGFPIGNGTNPDPTYYKKLPSYGLRNFPNNLEIAFGLQQQFINEGQLNWNYLYQTNIESANRGENAIHILYEDRVDDKLFSVNSIFNTTINTNTTLTASMGYKKLKSENFARIIDLLGGTGYLDVDSFADDLQNNPLAVQNNVLHPNRIVTEGERFKYNYNIFSTAINGFLQAQFQYSKVDFYVATSVKKTTYQREGLYQNGGFLENSLGYSKKLNFIEFSGKTGITYKITGRHLFNFNGAYLTKAPTIKNSFANARENNAVVNNITEEKIITVDASYILRLPIVQSKITGYYTKIKDANEISFFFADGIAGDTTAFVQEILQGIDKKYFGCELAIEIQATPSIQLKGVVALGQFTYDNNPNLYVASEDFVKKPDTDIFGKKLYGKTNLKNYKLATGPQKAYSIGFEYKDPDYWRIGATINFLSDSYADVSPIQRSSNFYTDFDGQPFTDYNPNIAKELLKQEKFKPYTIVNLTGGKSWKINSSYIYVFASINNLFDKIYKTGGFEQGRNANYRQLVADTSLETPVFGNKYWYGRGTSYFLNISYSF